jgi:hypothetical protein
MNTIIVGLLYAIANRGEFGEGVVDALPSPELNPLEGSPK